MTAPYPVLYNGLATSQGIYDVATSPVVSVGTRAALSDGRVYYYSRQSSSSAIVAGNMLQGELVSVDMDDLATDTHVIGDTAINVTPVGTKTYAANELAEGYVVLNSGTTGAGIAYKIKSNPVTVATTQFACTLYDSVVVAFNADTTATLVKNSWMDPIISATGQAHFDVGCSNIAVPAGNTTPQYFWCQTWGMAAVTAGDTTTAGEALMSDATTAGETLVATAGFQVIGINIFAAVNADHCPTFLQIAP